MDSVHLRKSSDCKCQKGETFGCPSPGHQVRRKGLPCSTKGNCYFTQIITNLKRKSAAQARILRTFERSQIGTQCNVTLTKSENEIFGSPVNTEENVSSILIHELETQGLDLNSMLKCWMKFNNRVEEFLIVEADIQNKLCINGFRQLTNLESTLQSIIQRTKNFEESELMLEENLIYREQKQCLQRSEERRRDLRNLVNSYLESEDRSHAIREDISAKEKVLYKERLIDRAALQLALKQMMRIMGAPEITEIQRTSSWSKKENTASRINTSKIQKLSELSMCSRDVPTCVNYSLRVNGKMSTSSFKRCSSERLASISRHSQETESSSVKEDSNLQAEKKWQPYNECEYNSRFSSNVHENSISVQIEDMRDTDSREASWWQQSKNKIRKTKRSLFGKKGKRLQRTHTEAVFPN